MSSNILRTVGATVRPPVTSSTSGSSMSIKMAIWGASAGAMPQKDETRLSATPSSFFSSIFSEVPVFPPMR